MGIRQVIGGGLVALAALLTGAPTLAANPLHGVALVIGESKYADLPVLTNPQKDARDIDRLLGDLGFEVDRVLNADGDELREAIARFTEEAKDADVALVYYSGHGIEAKGENFIAPTDTNLSSPQSAGDSLIAVQPMLEALSRAAPVSIVLLDACRSDPFPPGQMIVLPGDTAPTPVSSEGLAAVRGPTPVAKAQADPQSLGTIIGFAAEPGEPALDGAPGENSPYAAALLKHFAAGGYSFGDVMTMVTEEVYLKTKARQLPWTNSSLRRVLTFDAPAEEDDDPDAAAIKTERRKLLLSIAARPAETQKYVESLAGQEKVPLDALYGMLDALGVKTTDNDGDLQQQLQTGAERLKELIADRPASVKADPELERLSKLADDAEAEGAIALALKYRDQASGRADTLLAGKQAEADKLRADMVDIADTYAANAATALLNFDHVRAAELFGKAFDAAKGWDQAEAVGFRIKQGDALLDQGYYTTDNAALLRALQVYTDAATLAGKDTDPLNWAKLQDRMGQAQQTLGERTSNLKWLAASVQSYEAALTVRTRNGQPVDWATTQNNLANALYTQGRANRDIPVLRQAVAAFDASLTVMSPEILPIKWAGVESNRAVAEIDIANFIWDASSSAEMTAMMGGSTDPGGIPEVASAKAAANAVLDDAVNHLLKSVAVLDRGQNPYDWAMLQHTLASAYEQRGEMNHVAADLQQAVSAYEAVLTVHTREKTPALWIRTANNLAVTLKHLADETSDAVSMRRAVELYRQVVGATSRADQPYDWADYQQNLGNALGGLADYEDPVPNLEAAEAAYRSAEEITTLEARGPAKWQSLRTGLATTLLMHGLKAMDRAKVLEAKAAAIETRDRLAAAGAPDEAFFSQYLPLFDKVLGLFGN